MLFCEVVITMVQHIIILLIFLLAATYVARLLYRSFNSSSGCAKGCGACSTIDLQKIEAEVKRNQNVTTPR